MGSSLQQQMTLQHEGSCTVPDVPSVTISALRPTMIHGQKREQHTAQGTRIEKAETS